MEQPEDTLEYYVSLPITAPRGASKVERLANLLTPCFTLYDLWDLAEQGLLTPEQHKELEADLMPVLGRSLHKIKLILDSFHK